MKTNNNTIETNNNTIETDDIKDYPLLKALDEWINSMPYEEFMKEMTEICERTKGAHPYMGLVEPDTKFYVCGVPVN